MKAYTRIPAMAQRLRNTPLNNDEFAQAAARFGDDDALADAFARACREMEMAA